MNKPNWITDNKIHINGVTILVEIGQAFYDADITDDDTYVVGKSRRQIDTLTSLHFVKPVENILELGIYKGGSVVLYNEIFQPKTLIAVDLSTQPVEHLERYIDNKSLRERIHCYYGVDQADRRALTRIAGSHLGSSPLDLVIDDASHLIEQTRESFNFLFPLLAPGGYYIIEDWGWAHWNEPLWQEKGGVWPKEKPLTNLIFELTMLLASRPDLVGSLFLLGEYAVVKKAESAPSIPPNTFDLSSSFLNRGKRVSLLD